MLLAANTILEKRYSIVRLIKQGGMGAVYEAKDQRLGHLVALKQTISSGGQFEKAFEREARILASHPALPVVSDYFVERNNQFLVSDVSSKISGRQQGVVGRVEQRLMDKFMGHKLCQRHR